MTGRHTAFSVSSIRTNAEAAHGLPNARRAQKEARKAEAQALEAKAAAEAHLAEATSASRDAVSRVEQAQGEAVRMADELRDYKAGPLNMDQFL